MAKALRDITPKGDKKLLSDKLKGVKKSEIDSPDLDDLLMDPENMKGTKDFIKKYNKIEKHADRVGNTDAPYTASKGQAKYARQNDDMYEAAECSCDHDEDSCAVHGKKDKKLLLGGKKNMKEHAELSGLDAMPGAAPSGMVKNAESTWKNAEQYFDKPPTQLTGQGKPFLSKMGETVREAVREIQNEALANLQEKLTDEAKSKIRTALTPKMKQTSKPVRALVAIAKMNKSNVKEELTGNQHKLDKNHNGKLDKQDFKMLRSKKKMHEEEEVNEVAPPSKNSEEWIKKNKARFKKEYGAEKGERVLYGKAWNDYKEKH